jgi:EpsI family protein
MSDESGRSALTEPDLKMDRRSLIVGAGLAAAGSIYYARAPVRLAMPVKQGNFSAAIPEKVGQWTSRKSQEVVLPPQDDSNALYENLETRIYEAAGLPTIMLLIAFSSKQQNDIHVHRPEVCYPAAGFPVLWTRPAQISLASKSLTGRELLADRGGLQERIFYWVRVGHAFPISWFQQRLTMAVQNLQGKVPDGALVRVSAIEEPDKPTSGAIMDFIGAFLAEVPPPFRDAILL